MPDPGFFPESNLDRKLNLLLRGQQMILSILGQLALKSGHDAAKISAIDADIKAHTNELQAALDAAKPKET